MARRRTVAAPAERLWEVVSDPHHRPRWWPSVERVEDVEGDCWTDVVRSKRGKFVRADFTRTRHEPPRVLAWRLEVENSPLERFVAESVYRLELIPAGAEATEVQLQAQQRLRGGVKVTALMARRAAARQLEEALDGLDRVAGARGGAGG